MLKCSTESVKPYTGSGVRDEEPMSPTFSNVARMTHITNPSELSSFLGLNQGSDQDLPWYQAAPPSVNRQNLKVLKLLRLARSQEKQSANVAGWSVMCMGQCPQRVIPQPKDQLLTREVSPRGIHCKEAIVQTTMAHANMNLQGCPLQCDPCSHKHRSALNFQNQRGADTEHGMEGWTAIYNLLGNY